MNEYDARQIQRMRERLKTFRAGGIELGVLVRDLEALMELLQTPTADWKARFREHWFDMEQVHAVALDRPDEAVVQENWATIEAAVGAMLGLLDEQLGSSGG